MVIKNGSFVALHFDIRLKDGSIAESTRNFGKPFEFSMGKDAFLAEIEKKLLGLTTGDKVKVMLLPDQAFGEAHPAQIFQVPRDKFNALDQEEGLEAGSIMLFTQPGGREIPGLIREISEHEVTVDFNHPLAGQVLLFDIEILDVKDPH